MKKSLIVLALLAPLTLTGCVIAVDGDRDGHNINSSFDDREYDNRKIITALPLKSSIIDVKTRLGTADFTESYESEGSTINVLYYRTHRVHKDGLTTKDECTYLYFVDGALTDTGNGADFNRNMRT
ncbi:DUF3192 domain-containing protein [Thalassotalea profundi]|uniref:DUF3192 domain-containing protein n=1 Tax=Thalassotalea profundi TaxID=2036687 RepID=A0ABQ3IP14_9GAMM|nr:DUF3192 domain-containing protein [Thalassotalea profundi]GHE85253.1 hypothetical protein GCM10011501_12800 [Thalassotalea profundi]